MKRHPSLQVFSRDHNAVLILARRLADPASEQEALNQLVELWNEEMRNHFEEEERLLGPICDPDEFHRLRQDHGRIRRVIEAISREAPRPSELSVELESHTRWEERVLFPAIEQRASLAQLESVGTATELIERRRARSRFGGRRGELVKPRPPALLQSLSYLSSVAEAPGAQWGFAGEELNATLLTFEVGAGPPEHVNGEVEVAMLAVEGDGLVVLDGHRFDLHAGDLLILPKGLSRSIVAVSAKFTYLNLHRKRTGIQVGGITRPQKA